jgi:hypothetical protein
LTAGIVVAKGIRRKTVRRITTQTCTKGTLRPGNLRVVNLVEVEVVEEVNGALVGMGRVAVVQEGIPTPERLET